VAIQDINAKCEQALGTFSYMGGVKLSGLWKDALDQTPKNGIKKVYSEMYRAALHNEYWDIAQQVGLGPNSRQASGESQSKI
jgi:hypothetical protein